MCIRDRTNSMFVILDPTALPTTISDVPLNTDAIEAANSGNEVPNATIVTPIINGEIPKANPIFSAASMKISEAYKSIARQTTVKRI